MVSDRIIKIYHDFSEACSALINQHGVYCNRVFDTQIAYRLLTKVCDIYGTKTNENMVSADSLFRYNLGFHIFKHYSKDFEDEVRDDATVWHRVRPMTKPMIDYAG